MWAGESFWEIEAEKAGRTSSRYRISEKIRNARLERKKRAVYGVLTLWEVYLPRVWRD